MVGCFLIPNYPAWALLRHGGEPPLAVIDQGHVLAAGRQARAAGVEPGIRAGRARVLCEGITLRPRDHALESALWERVEKALNGSTPYVERAALGRTVFRPHDREELRRIYRGAGAQVGLAPTRLDAHLAARKAAEGRLLEISEEHLQSFRRGMPVERLVPLGVEEEVVERLVLFGYKNVAAVASLSKKHLKAQFGERGTSLYDRLHPSSKPNVSAYGSPPTIEEQRRFERPQRQVGTLEEAVDAMIDEAVAALGQRTTQRLTLRLDCREHGSVQGARILREPQSDGEALKSISHTLLKQQLSSEPAVDEMAVVLGALGQQGAEQGTLFFERPGVRRAVRRVHRRHPGILRRANLDHSAVFHEDRVDWEPALAGEEASG